MSRVALYARVSTTDKDQDPELQLRPMREHAGIAELIWNALDADADRVECERE